MKKISFVLAAVAIFSLSGSAHAADQYSWKASYIVKQGTGQISESLQGGPFDTQAACYADNRDKPAAAGAIGPQTSVGNGGFLCTCDAPIAQQGSACPGYVAPATQTTSTCSDSTPGVRYQPDPSGYGGTWICPDGSTNTVTTQSPPNPPRTAQTPTTPDGNAYVPVVTIPGLTDANSTLAVNQKTLANFLNNLYKYLIGIAAILAVIEIMWGGIMISTQRDSISSHSEGRKKIEHAIGGLVLVLLPALVFSIINPGILNLSINLPALDLTAPTVSSTLTKDPTKAASTQQNPTAYGTPTGQLIACDSGGSCSNAQIQCAHENNGSSGFIVLANEVVCVNSSGQIDLTAGKGGTNTCPSGESKQVQCVVQTGLGI